MDPITAALQLANTIAEIYKLQLESQPPEVRAELARLQLDDWKAFRAFWERILPKPQP